MLNVIHLIHHFNRGGIEMWLLSMLRQIPRSVCKMDVCCKGADVGPMAAIARQYGADVLHCPLCVNHMAFAREFHDLLLQGRYDLVHNHVGVYSGFPVWVAHQSNIPVITSFHNTQFAPQTSLTRFPGIRQLRTVYGKVSINYALHHSECVTGCSHAVIKTLDPTEQILRDRGQVIYYGVNRPDPVSSDARRAFRQAFGWPEDTPLILHVGRLVEQKNHRGLLSILQQVLTEIPTAKLLLVGDGPERSPIEALIEQMEIAHAVRLLGLRDDVSTLMGQSDVFLFPSIHEGFGLVAIEASAAGLPIVGSRIPGLVEAVKDGETALLHDVEDLQGMAQSVVHLLRDRPFAEQMGKAGQAWVQQHYSTEASARQLLDLYATVASVPVAVAA